MQVHDQVCRQCGEKLPVETPDYNQTSLEHCGQCIAHPPAFDQTLFAFAYRKDAATLIKRFKFNEDLMLNEFFAQVMSDVLLENKNKQPLPDVLIPIPLHSQRLRSRGFNQSFELAKLIGKKLKIPVLANALSRKLATIPQAGLRRKAREKNMKGAFQVNESYATTTNLKDKHIAIVDDVITTGATTKEAARELTKAAPGHIIVLAACKTLR